LIAATLRRTRICEMKPWRKVSTTFCNHFPGDRGAGAA
jgi:hypothetical protein